MDHIQAIAHAAYAQVKSTNVRYEADFEALNQTMTQRLTAALVEKKPIYRTTQVRVSNRYPHVGEEFGGLFKTYIDHMTNADDQRYHTCRCCQLFLNRFGDLATLDEEYNLVSVLWDETSLNEENYYYPAVKALREEVYKATIVRPLNAGFDTLGEAEKGGWTHFHLELDTPALIENLGNVRISNFNELTSWKQLLLNTTLRYPRAGLEKLQNLLAAKAVYRPEKIAHFVALFDELITAREKYPRKFSNICWHFTMTAPPGFTHFRNGLLGSFLDNLALGDANVALKQYNAMVDPDKYQRITRETNDAQIAKAEAFFAKLEGENPLLWRNASVDELFVKLWVPSPEATATEDGSMFGMLKKTPSVKAEPVTLPGEEKITWLRFQRDILPKVTAMRYQVRTKRIMPHTFLRQTFPDAAPLTQWDQPGQRNPFSAYAIHDGSKEGVYLQTLGLQPMQWLDVMAVAPDAPQQGAYTPPNVADAVVFILRDLSVGNHQVGTPIFPETFRSEYHEFKDVITKKAQITPLTSTEEKATGVVLVKGSQHTHIPLQVSMPGVIKTFLIDRWE